MGAKKFAPIILKLFVIKIYNEVINLKKTIKKGKTAISIFYEYWERDGGIPTRAEFENEYYGKVCERGESNYYYKVKENFLKQLEEQEVDFK